MATLALGYLIDLLAYLWGITDVPGQTNALVNFTKVIIGIGLAYLCITTVLQTQDDFRLVIPYVEFAKQLRELPKLIPLAHESEQHIVNGGREDGGRLGSLGLFLQSRACVEVLLGGLPYLGDHGSHVLGVHDSKEQDVILAKLR